MTSRDNFLHLKLIGGSLREQDFFSVNPKNRVEFEVCSFQFRGTETGPPTHRWSIGPGISRPLLGLQKCRRPLFGTCYAPLVGLTVRGERHPSGLHSAVPKSL